MRVGLCLVTWNELDGCQRDLPRLDQAAFDEVFAVDNHSTDGTVELLRDHRVEVCPQELPSYNGAYHSAFRRTTCDALVFFHPKGCIDPAATLELRPLFARGYDLVIASRIIAGGVNEEDSRWFRPRKSFVMLLAVVARVAWRRRGPMVWDVLHGFRGITVRAFEQMAIRPAGVTADLEHAVRSYRLGLRCVEFPVTEQPRRSGATHFPAWPTGKRLLAYLGHELLRPAAGEREGCATVTPSEIGADAAVPGEPEP